MIIFGEEFIKIIRQTHAGRIPSSPYLAHLTLERSPDGEVPSNQNRHLLFADRFALTGMELKILRLLIEGLSNEEIGQITCLARETIKGHLKSLFRKLDVKNRTEAAVLAVRDGFG